MIFTKEQLELIEKALLLYDFEKFLFFYPNTNTWIPIVGMENDHEKLQKLLSIIYKLQEI